MRTLSNINITCSYEDLEKTDLLIYEPYNLTVFWDDVKYEFYVQLRKDSDKVIFIGSGGLPKDKVIDREKPFYQRFTWDFGESIINFNDPSSYISDELLAGWGMGTLNNWYLEKIAVLIKIITNNIQVPNDKVIFYGSSMGGTTSLMLGTLIKDTQVLAEIPQFYIDKHPYWKTAQKVLFENMPLDKILNDYSYKIRVFDLIKREKYIPNAYILCDFSFQFDFKSQYLPFIEELNNLEYSDNTNIIFDIYGKNNGHAPLGKVEFMNRFKYFLTKIYGESKIVESESKQKLDLFNRARIDMKHDGISTNEIEVLYCSDFNAWVRYPTWFVDEKGQGLFVSSAAGKIDLKIKFINDGSLNMYLRGSDFKKNSGERFPIYIDFTKLIINDEVIFDERKLTWHNDYYKFESQVKDGDILNIHLEWEPLSHDSDF